MQGVPGDDRGPSRDIPLASDFKQLASCVNVPALAVHVYESIREYKVLPEPLLSYVRMYPLASIQRAEVGTGRKSHGQGNDVGQLDSLQLHLPEQLEGFSGSLVVSVGGDQGSPGDQGSVRDFVEQLLCVLQ